MISLLKKEWLLFKRSGFGIGLIVGFTCLSGFLNLAYLLFFQSSAILPIAFGQLAFLGVWIVPLLAMRTLPQEYQQGSFVRLATSPISPIRWALSTLLGPVLIWTLLLCLSLPFVCLVHSLSAAPLTPTVIGYTGLWLFGAAFTSLAVGLSARIHSPTTSAWMSFCLLLFLWMSEGFISFLPPQFSELSSVISVQHHLDMFLKGTLNTESILFFLNLAIIGFILLYSRLSHSHFIKLLTLFIFSVCCLVTSHFFPARWNQELNHPLSSQTQWLLKQIHKPVTFTLEASAKAPEFQRMAALLDQIRQTNSQLTIRVMAPKTESTLTISGLTPRPISISKGSWYEIPAGSTEPLFTGEHAIAQALKQALFLPKVLAIIGLPADKWANEYSILAQKLNTEGIQVLLTQTVPTRCDSLWIYLGPHSTLTELPKTQKPMLITLSPNQEQSPLNLLATMGLHSTISTIFEESQSTLGNPDFFYPKLLKNRFNTPLTAQRLGLVLSQATPIWPTSGTTHWQPLLRTSTSALAGQSPEQYQFEGPFDIAFINPTDRILVIGSNALFQNKLIQEWGNTQWVLNAFEFLNGYPPTVGPRMVALYTFKLTRFQFGLTALFFLILYPISLALWIIKFRTKSMNRIKDLER